MRMNRFTLRVTYSGGNVSIHKDILECTPEIDGIYTKFYKTGFVPIFFKSDRVRSIDFMPTDEELDAPRVKDDMIL